MSWDVNMSGNTSNVLNYSVHQYASGPCSFLKTFTVRLKLVGGFNVMSRISTCTNINMFVETPRIYFCNMIPAHDT